MKSLWLTAVLGSFFAGACAPTLEDTGMIHAGSGDPACPDGFVARYGRCCPTTSTPDQCPTAGAVGSACTANQDCLGTATYSATCLTDLPDEHITHGYCSAMCTQNSECEPGSVCIDSACLRTCATANMPCSGPSGTYCLAVTGQNVCLPDCTAGGATCGANADCLGDYHVCAHRCAALAIGMTCASGGTCTHLTGAQYYCL